MLLKNLHFLICQITVFTNSKIKAEYTLHAINQVTYYSNKMSRKTAAITHKLKKTHLKFQVKKR